jgi:hypothetical protein
MRPEKLLAAYSDLLVPESKKFPVPANHWLALGILRINYAFSTFKILTVIVPAGILMATSSSTW